MATTLDAPTNKPSSGVFYGWFIVAFSFLSLVVSNGLAINGMSTFFKPILTDLIGSGAIPAKNNLAGTATSLTIFLAGLLSPLSGWLISRVNLRVLFTVGCFLLGGGLIIYSQAHTAGMVYTAHALMGLSLCFVGALTNTVLVSNWFSKKRGVAMGIVLTGTSAGGVLIPQIARPIIESAGWRTAMMCVSLLIWLVLLPAVWLIVRVHPSDKGLLPDGDAVPTDGPAVKPVLTGYTLGEALRTVDFWIFAAVAVCLFYAILTVVQQLALYLQSPLVGLSLLVATNTQSLMNGMSVVGKFSFGWLGDRLPKSLVLFLCATVMLVGAQFLWKLTGATIFPFAIIFGLAYGGAFVSIQVLAVERFGLKEAGKIVGAITVVETLGGAIGLFLTGWLAQRHGYAKAFYGVIVVSALGVLFSFILHQVIKRAKALKPAKNL